MAQINIKALLAAAQWAAKHPAIEQALSAAISASSDNKAASTATRGLAVAAWDAWNDFAVKSAAEGATPALVNALIDCAVSDSESAAKTVKTYRSTAVGLVGVLLDPKRDELLADAGIESDDFDFDHVKRNEATKLIKAKIRRSRVLYTDRLSDAIKLLASSAREYASVEAHKTRLGERFDRKDVDRGEMAQLREEAAKEALSMIEDAIGALGGDVSVLPIVSVEQDESNVFDELDPMEGDDDGNVNAEASNDAQEARAPRAANG